MRDIFLTSLMQLNTFTANKGKYNMQYATCSNIEKIKKQRDGKTEEQRQKGRKLNKTQRGGKIREWESV